MSLLRQQAQKCLANQVTHKGLNAFIATENADAVLRSVEADSGTDSPLRGRLIAVKDNICTADLPTTCASSILQKFRSPYDATVVEKLRKAGAVVAGKTNMDEFGMGSHSVHSAFGAAYQMNADGQEVSAGGSSGGSAIAVATQQCWAALGTDTGGSVRLPAAYTGIVGFKPSYGLVSRWGVVAYANSLDTVGVLARDTAVAKQVFDAVNGYDASDPTSLAPSTRSRIQAALSSAARRTSLRIGVPTTYNIAELSPVVRRAWLKTLQKLRSQGHSLHPVSLPATSSALSAYYVLAPAEASSNLAKYDGVRYGTRAAGPDGGDGEVLFSRTRGQGFGDEVRRRIVLGAYTLSSEAMDNYFIRAQRVRRLVQGDFDAVFRAANPLMTSSPSANAQPEDHGVDVLVCPTAPGLPPSLKQLQETKPVDAYVNDVLTVPASLAGLPAVSVPVAVEGNGEPDATVGMQVIGQYGHDDLVLEVGGMVGDFKPGAA
ncbi:glutamyl-tRNA amidotransferase subunit A [Phyllosticta capitalensis]